MLPLISASNGNIIVSRLVFSLAIFAVLTRTVAEIVNVVVRARVDVAQSKV
jgi:cell division protein FtsB